MHFHSNVEIYKKSVIGFSGIGYSREHRELLIKILEMENVWKSPVPEKSQDSMCIMMDGIQKEKLGKVNKGFNTRFWGIQL